MIPRDFILEWREHAPWPHDFQVEQDLIISRALVEIFYNPVLLRDALAFRGGTAIYKLHLRPAPRYAQISRTRSSRRSRLDFTKCE